MKDTMKDATKRDALAEEIHKTAVYEKAELAHPDRPIFKAYKVRVGDLQVGEVRQCLERVHRKVGRIICGTSRVARWTFTPTLAAERAHLLYYDTRAKAATALIERVLAHGWTLKNGQLQPPRSR